MRVNQSILGLLLACAGVSSQATAQAATNLGSINVTSSSTTMVTVTLSSAGPSSGTVSSVAVVTQGIPNADFTDAGGGSCSAGASYSANATCTVNVKFTPKYPGTRYGAVVLTGAGGTLATQLIQATGIAPEADLFPSASQFVNVADGVGEPSAIAVDPEDNLYFSVIYFANNLDTGKVWKLTASSMYQTTTQIGSGFVAPLAVALDGTGNVYVTDGGNPMIPAGLYKETLSNGDYIQTEISNGFVNPASIAVDGSGSVYVADAGMLGGWPSIRSKGLSRHKTLVRCVSTADLAREVEDQSSGLNHAASP
jgi:hypothetical protein